MQLKVYLGMNENIIVFDKYSVRAGIQSFDIY